MATKLPGIPGLDVTELGTIENPTNPSFKGSASPEAQAYQSMRSAPSVPGAAAGEAAAARGGAYSAGRAVGQGLRSATGGAGAAVPLVVGAGAVGAVQQAGADDSTARYAKRFATSEPTGDGSFGDMTKFAALRAGGFASDLGANILDTGTSVVNGVRSMAGAAPIQSFRSLLFRDGDPNQPTGAPAALALRSPAAAQALTPSQNQPVVGAPTGPSNTVFRNGNSFSGTDVTQGFQYQDPNGMRSPSGNMNTVPTMATLDPALSTRLQEAKLGALSRGESLETNRPAMSLGGSHGSSIEDLARSGKLSAAGLNAVIAGRGQDIGAATAERGQDVTSQGQGLQYDLGLRGQDVSSATARAQARFQQMQNDRMYNLDVAKFGEEQAKTRFNQREQSDKDLTSKLESMFTTYDDKGKAVVDSGKVAAHKAGITAAIGTRINDQERIPENSPDYKQAQKLADSLRTNGAAALSEDGLQKLIAQLDVKQRAAAAHSAVNPFGGTFIDSSDPRAYDIVGKDNGLLQDDYRLRNGSTVPARDLDKVNGDLIGGQRTTRFDILKQGLR